MNPLCRLIDIASELARKGTTDVSDYIKEIEAKTGLTLDKATADALWQKGWDNHVKGRTPTERQIAQIDKKLTDVQRNMELSTAKEFINGATRAGMLLGLRAAQASVFGNTGAAILEGTAKLPSVVVDAITSKATGQRSMNVDPARSLSAVRSALSREMLKEVAQIVFSKGRDIQTGYGDHKRIDYQPFGVDAEGVKGAVNWLTRQLSAVANKSFDLLDAADRPARMMHFQAALYEAATLRAQREGHIGKNLEARVQELLKDGSTPELIAQALAGMTDATSGPLRQIMIEAKTAEDQGVFANTSDVTRAASAVSKMAENVPYAGVFVLPFPKIPTNVVMRGLEWSPLGTLYGAKKLQEAFTFRGTDVGRAAQRSGSLALGRSVTGAGMMALGYILAKSLPQGYFSPPPPVQTDERDMYEAMGKQGSSILIGGRYFSLRDIPQLLPFWAGVLYRQFEQRMEVENTHESPVALATKAGVSAVTQSALDLPTMQGVSNIQEDIQKLGKKAEPDTEKTPTDLRTVLGKSAFVRNMAGGMVPTAVSDVSSWNDPYQRYASDAQGKIQADLPGREKLPVRVDALGRPIERAAGPLSQVRGLGPDVSRKLNDPVAKELDRLGVTITKPTRVTANSRPDRDLTDAQYMERVKAVGQSVYDELKATIESDWYKSGTTSDKERREELEYAVKAGRKTGQTDIKDKR